MSEFLYEIDGNMGKILKVCDDKCIISTKSGLKALMFGASTNGDKEFYYKNITSLQFKNLGLTSGYLQFEYPGSHNVSNFNSENSFIFSASIGTSKHRELKEKMPGVYEDIQNKIANAMSSASGETGISSADELKKFKELLDNGVISQEEFNAKKKQLLGL